MTRLLCSIPLALLLLAAVPAAAAPVPLKLNVQGVLRDADGALQTRTVDFTFRIYAVATGGNALHEETQPSVPVVGGVFSVNLGEGTGSNAPLDPALFENNGSLWLGVTPGAGTELPRFPLTTTGFAFQAEHANRADNAGLAANATAATRAMSAATADNATNAARATTADNATLAATATVAQSVVALGVTRAALANGAVGYDQLEDRAVGTDKLNDGAVTAAKVAVDAITGAAVQDGTLDLADLDVGTCMTGQVVKAGAMGWECGTDTDTNTTYTAGAGLALTGGVFSVDQITGAMLAPNAVTADKVLDGTLTFADLATAAVATSGGNNGTATTLARSDHTHGACPTGMGTATSRGSRICAAVVNAATNWNGAVDGCWATYGASLCSLAQLRVACSQNAIPGGLPAPGGGRWVADRFDDNRSFFVNSANCGDLDGKNADTNINRDGYFCCLMLPPP
jgi:hypothetical protein